MDTVDEPKERFEEIQKELGVFLKKVGFQPNKTSYVAISGFRGDNLVEPSKEFSWYTGKTLIQELDGLVAPPRMHDKPLRIPLQDVYKIKGIGTVPVGRVETGIIKPGMKLLFAPGNIKSEVKTVE